MKKTGTKLARAPETKAKGRKNGAALLHIDVLSLPLPGKPQGIPPLPPVGRDPLPRMGIGVAQGGNKTNVVPPMGLTLAQMLNETKLQRGAGRRELDGGTGTTGAMTERGGGEQSTPSLKKRWPNYQATTP